MQEEMHSDEQADAEMIAPPIDSLAEAIECLSRVMLGMINEIESVKDRMSAIENDGAPIFDDYKARSAEKAAAARSEKIGMWKEKYPLEEDEGDIYKNFIQSNSGDFYEDMYDGVQDALQYAADAKDEIKEYLGEDGNFDEDKFMNAGLSNFRGMVGDMKKRFAPKAVEVEIETSTPMGKKPEEKKEKTPGVMSEEQAADFKKRHNL